MKHWILGFLGAFWLGLVFLIDLAPPDFQQSAGEETRSPNWRFGVVESYENTELADTLGAGWTRVGFHWAKSQPDGPRSYEPAIPDDVLNREVEAGRTILGMLIGIPDWARDEAGLPQGLWLKPDDPENHWANYVREMVKKYKGRVDHWVIWNEPDIPSGEIAHSWDGSVADFAQLQRVAYLAAKEVNPQAVIHLSAFTYWADFYAGTEQYMQRLLEEIGSDPEASQQNYYFDVATAHLYFQPNQIYDLLIFFQEIIRKQGLDKPIWLVETNAPPIDDSSWPVSDWTLSVTSREQAAFVPQGVASALAAGADRVAIYKLQDTEEDRAANPEPFGLVRMDGSRREAFDTYRIVIKHLAGAFAVERERWDEVGQIRFDQPGQSTTVVFSRLPMEQQAQVPATSGTASLVDMFGTSDVITPTNGSYVIDLPGARCSQSIGDYCMIGGYTFYLVQEASRQPPTATAVPTETPRLIESPTIQPTSTAEPQTTAIQNSSPTARLNGDQTKDFTPTPKRQPTSTIETGQEAASNQLEDEEISPSRAGQQSKDMLRVAILIMIGLVILLLLGAGWYISRRR